MLTFVVPVRHPDSVRSWRGVCDQLADTSFSLAAQSHSNWNAVVVVNRGARLPKLPARFDVVEVDLDYTPAPQDLGGRYEATRLDKGLRVLAGLQELRPQGHVMVVDHDDWVSCRLAEHVDRHAGSPGWVIQDGYLYKGRRLLLRVASLHLRCGSTLILRHDLLRRPPGPEIPLEFVCRRLGSHRLAFDDLQKENVGLQALPFPGAVYRVGSGMQVSGTGSLLWRKTPSELIYHPRRTLRDLKGLRLVNSKLRAEFGIR